jgi:environmental stress-induced protein Ves
MLRAENYRKGRWLNGLGLSWDIAAEPRDAGALDFAWRLALAQIESSVGFSHYPDVDRIFTLTEGHGLELVFNDREGLKIDRPFVPHEFPGDVKTACVVNHGPCRALNLFIRRRFWKTSVRVLSADSILNIDSAQTTLAFALRGSFKLGTAGTLNCGETLIVSPGESAAIESQGKDALLYLATLTPVRQKSCTSTTP